MTTSTLRPNAARSSVGTNSASGAATVWQAVSDSSDSSYADCTGTNSIEWELGTVSLPAGAVTKTLSCSVRAASVTTLVRVRGLVEQIVTVPNAFLANVDANTTTLSIATYTGTPIAVSLSQADIDNLSWLLSVTTSGGVHTRVYEAWADLIYVTAPVVSVTGPTGTVTTTSTPTIAWTYTPDADGDVQARYQVRTFTAAQYGAGGFDPATSPAAHDTGIVASASTSVSVGPLANSTTYRSYVAVADSINGNLQWSAWTAFTGYSLSLTTADIASVVGTADNANGRISVVVTRVTAGSPPTWQTVEVQRSDDAGATWQYVRSANGVAVSGTTYTVLDYEAPNGVAVLFRSRATYTSGSNDVTSAWVTSVGVTWTAAVDWLKHPSHPGLNRTVTIESNPQLGRARRQGVLQVLGRSDPVVISDVLNLTTGTLTFVTFTDQDAVDLLALFAYDVLFIQARPGARFGQRYIAIGDVTEVPPSRVYSEPTRWFQVPFNEVLTPIDTGVS